MQELFCKIDIDGVCADLCSEWLKRYRRKYKHKLFPKDITDWNTHQFVVPECGTKIYDFVKTPKIYDKVKPIPYALEGVQSLRDLGFTIIYTTACFEGQAGRKYSWLKEHGFWNEKDHYVETNSKHLIKGDLLIDDRYENVINSNCYSILLSQYWNLKYHFANRMNDWREIIIEIERYKKYKNGEFHI